MKPSIVVEASIQEWMKDDEEGWHQLKPAPSSSSNGKSIDSSKPFFSLNIETQLHIPSSEPGSPKGAPHTDFGEDQKRLHPEKVNGQFSASLIAALEDESILIDRDCLLKSITNRPRSHSVCVCPFQASENSNRPLEYLKTADQIDSVDHTGTSSGWKSLKITSFNPRPTFIQAMNTTDDHNIEYACGAHELMAKNNQQVKLARDKSRERVRRIVAIVSVALTLLAVLLVTAFLALGSKLEKETENAKQNNGGASPFADESHKRVIEVSRNSHTPSSVADESVPKNDSAKTVKEKPMSRYG